SCKVIHQRSAVAVNFQTISRSQRIHAAKFKDAFRTILKTTEHVEQIGNNKFIALAIWMHNLATRENAGDIAQPALQNLHVDSEREHVQSADLNLLPPMRRRVRIQIVAGKTLQPDMMRTADVIFCQ